MIIFLNKILSIFSDFIILEYPSLYFSPVLNLNRLITALIYIGIIILLFNSYNLLTKNIYLTVIEFLKNIYLGPVIGFLLNTQYLIFYIQSIGSEIGFCTLLLKIYSTPILKARGLE